MKTEIWYGIINENWNLIWRYYENWNLTWHYHENWNLTWHYHENWNLTWHYKWKPGHTLVVLHEDILTVSSLFFRSSNLHDHGQWPLVIVVMTMISIAMISIIIPFLFCLGCDSYSQHHHHHHRHITKSPKSTMVPLSLGLEHRVERLHGGWIFTSAEVHSPFKTMFKAPVLIII